MGDEEDDLSDFLKIRDLNRDLIKGEDVIKCIEMYGDPEEIEMAREIGSENIGELQKRRFV